MKEIDEGNLKFSFEDSWDVSKLDNWAFYRRQFEKHFDSIVVPCKKCKRLVVCKECDTKKALGAKCCDLLAIDGATTWLIEIKDYRIHQRVKTIDLADEIALKVRDSLAMLLAASKNANDPDEKTAAGKVASSTKIHVVLHLEQPAVTTRLRPTAINKASVVQRLKQLLKCVDPHPRVVDTGSCTGLNWQVS